MQLPFAIRRLGQLLFRRVPVRIASGLNQGMRWSIVTTGRGYGSGSFAKARLAVLEAVVQPGECFWDIGAHKGFVTLAASGLVGPEGTVVSVEPASINRWFLHRHLAWNGVTNVVVAPVALSGRRGERAFGGHGDSLAYTLGKGEDRVPVRRIPEVVEELDVPRPDVIKIDAEGQEAAILDGAGDALRPHVAVLVSVHGRAMHAACHDIFAEHDFRTFESWEMACCSSDPERPWTSDYEMLAVGPERVIDEERIRSLPLFAGVR
ncbi:MAG: FkbM family methyltransferase [Longimicrobiales bacterium]|nr:FkbM family methyltransferase [Longimicrobiales bacterium]